MNISTLLKSIKLLLIGVTIVFMSACKGPDISRFHGSPDKDLNKRDVVYLSWEVETLPIATSFDVQIESTPPLDIAGDLEKSGDLEVQVFETTEFVLTAKQAVLGFSYTTTETLVVEVNDPTDLATLQFHDENLEECIHRTAAEKNIVYVEDVVELDCSNSEIGMLKGIEQLMNLEKLVLKNNYLGNARENILLPKLKYLDVSSNFINSLSDVIEIDAWNTKLEALIVADVLVSLGIQVLKLWVLVDIRI